jgi:hypothetical protein
VTAQTATPTPRTGPRLRAEQLVVGYYDGHTVLRGVIGLDELVSQGIVAMAEGRVSGKVVVDPMSAGLVRR